MKMNWKNASQGVVVEPGTYYVQVKKWKPHVSANGNDCIIFEHTVVGPEDSPALGAMISDFITLTENAAWRLAAFVGNCGINVAELPDMDTKSEDFQRILNACTERKIWLTVSKEADKTGKIRNKVVEYIIDDDQEPVDLDLEDVPEFIKNKGKEMKASEQAPF